MPVRIQRKREKGWKAPAGAVYVGRPSKWGNPFRVDGDWRTAFRAAFIVGRGYKAGQRACAVELLRLFLTAPRKPLTEKQKAEHEANFWAKEVMTIADDVKYPTVAEIKAELCGKDLLCWCDRDQPCHADVLLEIANS